MWGELVVIWDVELGFIQLLTLDFGGFDDSGPAVGLANGHQRDAAIQPVRQKTGPGVGQLAVMR